MTAEPSMGVHPTIHNNNSNNNAITCKSICSHHFHLRWLDYFCVIVVVVPNVSGEIYQIRSFCRLCACFSPFSGGNNFPVQISRNMYCCLPSDTPTMKRNSHHYLSAAFVKYRSLFVRFNVV